MADTWWTPMARDTLMVHGPDALSYLQSQASQDLQDLAVGQARWSFLLEPNGKVGSLVRVLRSGDAALIVDVDEGFGEAVEARLQRFRIRVKAEIEPVEWGCLAVRGPDAASVGASAGTVALHGWWGDGTAVDLLGPAPAPPAGLRQAEPAELEAARVTAVWPAMGREITEATIPAETGLIDVAVSFTKGCYPGQELVERMDSRGAQAPRRLCRLDLDGDALVALGSEVVVDGSPVGAVTSAVPGSALALVRRTVEPGSRVSVGGVPAVVA